MHLAGSRDLIHQAFPPTPHPGPVQCFGMSPPTAVADPPAGQVRRKPQPEACHSAALRVCPRTSGRPQAGPLLLQPPLPCLLLS